MKMTPVVKNSNLKRNLWEILAFHFTLAFHFKCNQMGVSMVAQLQQVYIMVYHKFDCENPYTISFFTFLNQSLKSTE